MFFHIYIIFDPSWINHCLRSARIWHLFFLHLLTKSRPLTGRPWKGWYMYMTDIYERLMYVYDWYIWKADICIWLIYMKGWYMYMTDIYERLIYVYDWYIWKADICIWRYDWWCRIPRNKKNVILIQFILLKYSY